MKIYALPTWVVTMVIWSILPDDHPWKKRKRFTLKEWHSGRTEMCKLFDLALWLNTYFLIVIVVRLFLFK